MFTNGWKMRSRNLWISSDHLLQTPKLGVKKEKVTFSKYGPLLKGLGRKKLGSPFLKLAIPILPGLLGPVRGTNMWTGIHLWNSSKTIGGGWQKKNLNQNTQTLTPMLSFVFHRRLWFRWNRLCFCTFRLLFLASQIFVFIWWFIQFLVLLLVRRWCSTAKKNWINCALKEKKKNRQPLLTPTWSTSFLLKCASHWIYPLLPSLGLLFWMDHSWPLNTLLATCVKHAQNFFKREGFTGNCTAHIPSDDSPAQQIFPVHAAPCSPGGRCSASPLYRSTSPPNRNTSSQGCEHS